MKERTIENPTIRDSVTFVRTSEETDCEYREGDIVVQNFFEELRQVVPD